MSRADELQEKIHFYQKWGWENAAAAAAVELEKLRDDDTQEEIEILEERVETYRDWGWDVAANEILEELAARSAEVRARDAEIEEREERIQLYREWGWNAAADELEECDD